MCMLKSRMLSIAVMMLGVFFYSNALAEGIWGNLTSDEIRGITGQLMGIPAEITENTYFDVAKFSRTKDATLSSLKAAQESFEHAKLDDIARLEDEITMYKTSSPELTAYLTEAKKLANQEMANGAKQYISKIAKLEAIKGVFDAGGKLLNLYDLVVATDEAISAINGSGASVSDAAFKVSEKVASFNPIAGGIIMVKDDVDKLFTVSGEIVDSYSAVIYGIRDAYYNQYNTLANKAGAGETDASGFIELCKQQNNQKISQLRDVQNEIVASMSGVLVGNNDKLQLLDRIGEIIVQIDPSKSAQKQQEFFNRSAQKYRDRQRALAVLGKLKKGVPVGKFAGLSNPTESVTVSISVSPSEVVSGSTVSLSGTTSTAVGSVSLSVTKDGKPEKVIDLVSPNQKEWMAGLEIFDQSGIRTITATAKDKSGAVLGTSQPVTITVKPAEAKAPTAVVTAVTATTDNIKLNDSVGFVANISGTLAEGDQVKLVLDNWSTVMPKVGNRWGNTVGIDEAVNGKRMYSAHVVGKNGLSSASTQPKQITVLSPITIKSVVVKKDKQNVEINNCVLGDNVDFFVTTTGATNGISELFLVMDGKDYVMKSVDGQTWTFKAWIGEAPGGKRNYTAYARHKGTLSARPGLKSLFVAPRTRVTSIDAFMNERPTSTFSSGTPIKFVVKLDGQTDGKVVVMIDQFKMEIAKPDANGNWTASAPIWDKDGKTRTFWAYVEEGYLQGISSAKKTLTSNSDQPNSVDCGNQHVKVNDEIHLKVTTGNGGYNLVGTLAGAGGGLDMRFHALNDVVWEWAHQVKETRKGVLTATIKVEDKPEGGKVIDTFTCTYAFNGATLPTTSPVPTTPAKVTSVTYSPNPANPDFPFTVTVHTDISPAVPPMIINHNSPLHMGSDGTESTIQLDLAKDFGIPANSTTGEISLVVLLHDGLGGSTNTTVKIPYARSNNQQVVKDLYDRFKAGYSSRNMAALQGLISDDWQSESDGTTLSDLEDNLRRSFKIYNQISYTISNLQIAAMSDAKRFRVSYDVRIVGTVYQPNLRHDEQSSVTEEVVVDQGGKAKIAKTLNGRFWSVK